MDIKLDIYRGDTFIDVIQYSGSNSLTGATALVYFKLYPADTTVVLSNTPVIDDILNTVTITLTSEETTQLNPYNAPCCILYYDVQLTLVSGNIETIQKGTADIEQEVTYITN